MNNLNSNSTIVVNWSTLDQALPEASESQQEAFVRHAKNWAEANGYAFETIRNIQKPGFDLLDANGERDQDEGEHIWSTLLEGCDWDVQA